LGMVLRIMVYSLEYVYPTIVNDFRTPRLD
jgi:hypothetical protein